MSAAYPMAQYFSISEENGYAGIYIFPFSEEARTFQDARFRLDKAAAVAEAKAIVKDDWIRSHYELVPKGTIAKLAQDYKARLASRPYKKTSDIDLPMIDDEEDW